MTMDWNDLRYFLAVARGGSLSAASRETRVSQATISRRIQLMEQALGIALFERLNTGYVLTEAGRSILARAEAAESTILSIERGAAAAGTTLQGSVRLATGEALASDFIAPHVTRFRNEHPGLRLEFVTGFRAISLSRREADVALRLIRPDQGDHVRRRVASVGFGLYAAASYLETCAPSARDPWAVDLVGWDESMRDIPMAGWVKEPALSRVVATSTSMRTKLALVSAGIGAGVFPCFVADAVPGLQRLAGPSGVGSLDLWLVAQQDLSRSLRVRAVLDFIADLCREEKDRLRGE
jgi:DNA-binding transcriptional LysR family regulator